MIPRQPCRDQLHIDSQLKQNPEPVLFRDIYIHITSLCYCYYLIYTTTHHKVILVPNETLF